MRRPIAAAAAAALALSILAGCGEKDEPATTGPVVTTDTTSTTPAITSTTTPTPVPDEGGKLGTSAVGAVHAFLSAPDAEAVCDEVLTEEFLRKAYGDRAGCIAARNPASLADPGAKVEVGPPSNAGTRVDTEPVGGIYDGQKLQITVIQEGKAFLISEVQSNVPVGP